MVYSRHNCRPLWVCVCSCALHYIDLVFKQGGMTKKEIHECFVRQLSDELEAIRAAAKDTFATATNEEHHAKSKYETFSLESSYLARGQAKRVEELTTSLERLQMLPLKPMEATTPIQLGALVRLESDSGETRTLFFAPAGGGEKLDVDGEQIMLLTSSSPMGRAIVGKTTGHRFEITLGGSPRTFTIVSVE
jgi:transcription elongation GreA/GreB family factor